MALIVRRPGVHSLLVDGGRPSSRHFGIPLGGPADRASWMLGNALVGNDPHSAALEITLSGPTLEATARHSLVLFGAPFEFELHTSQGQVEKLHPGHIFQTQPGDIIRILGVPSALGVRAYLCAPGSFSLGGKSSLVPIQATSQLDCPPSALPRSRWIAPTPDWDGAEPRVLRLLPGSHLTKSLRSALSHTVFTVRPESDRMGVRLASEESWTTASSTLVSTPVAPGTVQLPAGGQPMILGVDAQTIGGYPRLAHVISADLDRLGQLRPGARLCFEFVEPRRAEELSADREAWLRSWLHRLNWSA